MPRMDIEKAYQDRYTLAPLSRRRLNTDSVVHFAAAVYTKIRRAYFVQGKAIKAICRELNVSRKVVRKVLRSEATEFRYEREEQPLPIILQVIPLP